MPQPHAEPILVCCRRNWLADCQNWAGVGAVFDNNTTNMAVQISGFRSAHTRGPTLDHYQEVSAHHLPQRMRDYVGAYPND
jgi:hypothetical protein